MQSRHFIYRAMSSHITTRKLSSSCVLGGYYTASVSFTCALDTQSPIFTAISSPLTKRVIPCISLYVYQVIEMT